MRKPTIARLEQLERLADRVLRDDVVRPVIALELPALPERGWDGPRMFFVGEQPDGAEEALFDHEDGKPGWPSTPDLNAIMGELSKV